MGRELQKRKARSSTSKVRRNPKSKKKLLHHPVIAANWDNSQTLTQNYQRLGLTAKLNKNTGGVEKTASSVSRVGDGEQLAGWRRDDALSVASVRRSGMVEVREVGVERDGVTGGILRVVEEGGRANPLGDLLNELDSAEDGEERGGAFDQHSIASLNPDSQPKTAVVGRLEEEARRPAAKYKRKQPEGERAFIAELVEKYGDDYGKMARDAKINYMQRSEGDLKRRVKRWRESGGVV